MHPTSLFHKLRRAMPLWNALSAVGRTLGSESLTYNRGIFRFFHETALRSAPVLADALARELPHARRVIDLGCGTGALLAALHQRHGLDVLGCERSPKGRAYAQRAGVPVRPFDLRPHATEPIPGAPFDVAMSFEVAEHLPPPLGDELVRVLATLAPTVVFSAAHPGQGGIDHINEQPKAYWLERFAARALRPDEAGTARLADRLRDPECAPWFARNILLLRAQPGPAD